PAARLRYRAPHRADQRRAAQHQLRHPLPGTAQARAGRVHRLRMGRLGAQPAGQVLPAHAGGSTPGGEGDARVGADGDHPRALPRAQAVVMRPLRALWARVLGLFDRDRREREFAEELESHLEMHVEDNLRAGLTREDGARAATAPPDFYEYRARNHSLRSLSSFYARPVDLTGGDEPERIRILIVSSEFLGTLGVAPAMGRDMGPADERWGDHRVVLL